MTFNLQIMKKLTIIIFLNFLIFILGCSNQKKRWEEAKINNTITSYEEFIKNYPDSPNANLAKQTIEELYWQDALKSHRLIKLNDFQKKYPKSSHANELQTNIDVLETDSIIGEVNTVKLKEWIEIHKQSSLKTKIDSLLRRVEIPFEYSMDIHIQQTSTIHPMGKINSLKLQGLKIEIIEPTLQDGFLRTKDFGNIEVVWKQTKYLDEQQINLYATQLQINKIKYSLLKH